MPVPQRLARLALPLAAFGLILPAAAQDKADQPARPDDIVVTGMKDKERDEQIRDFVRGMTDTPGKDPLARFDIEKLCPRAVGLGTGYDRAITDRLRRVAGAAKIDLAKADCRYPNALVIFTSDKAATIALLRDRYPWLFRDKRGDPIQPEKQTGLATLWHVETMVDRDGVPIRGQGNSVPVSRTTGMPSRIRALARPVFLMSVMVVERRAVDGLTMTQIADYAALRLYSDADPAKAKDGGVPTILTILDAPMGSETPMSMTAWDLNFLRGLYASPVNSYSNAQRGAIGSYMKREMDKGSEGKK